MRYPWQIGMRGLGVAGLAVVVLSGVSVVLGQAQLVPPRITLEGADATWHATLADPEPLRPVGREVVPRIVCEYATASLGTELGRPTGIEEEAIVVGPQITFEHASASWSASLGLPEELVVVAQDVGPRIVVEHAAAGVLYALERPPIYLDMEVVKTASAQAFTNLNETITYTIVVTNTGNHEIRDIEVDDDLTGDTWAIASLEPGESHTITVEYAITQSDMDAGQVSNTVTATGREPRPIDRSDTVTIAHEAPPVGILRVARGEVLEQVQKEAPSSVLLIIDASGSMGDLVEGVPKIDIAKEVLLEIVEVMPDLLEVGLLVFKSCDDIELVVPVSPLDRQALSKAIEEITPYRLTPIAGAIQRVPSIMEGHPEPYLVVLVTDGMETCHGDPVQAARDLMAEGFELRMHVIGYDVEAYAHVQQQLREIAAEADGSYFPADSIGELREAILLMTPVGYVVYDSDGDRVYSGIVGDEARELPAGRYTVVFHTVKGEVEEQVEVVGGTETTVWLDYIDGEFEPRVE